MGSLVREIAAETACVISALHELGYESDQIIVLEREEYAGVVLLANDDIVWIPVAPWCESGDPGTVLLDELRQMGEDELSKVFSTPFAQHVVEMLREGIREAGILLPCELN